jgi:ATP-dependent protease La (LON) substrate-binding domain
MMVLLLILCLHQVSCCRGGWNHVALPRSSLSFVATRVRRRGTVASSSTTTRLFYDVPYEEGFSGNNNRKKKDMKSNKKMNKNPMDIVRSLQESLYTSEISMADTPPFATFRRADMTIENLPLWQVPWHEVPGRSNILHVNDAIYTNMMEQILRSKQHQAHRGRNVGSGWYIGHLYVPPPSQQGLSSKNLKSSLKKQHHQLRAWNDHRPISSSSSNHHDALSSLGTLLRITDYRRLVDGRLVLLVQAMERFVVTRVQQELPFGLVTVQLLPDAEEVDDDSDNDCSSSSWVQERTENDVAPARAWALQESFQMWHAYEYENTLLPLPQRSSSSSSSSSRCSNGDLEESDVVTSALATVLLPFAPYSSTVNVTQLAAAESMKDEDETLSWNVVNDDAAAATANTDIQGQTTTTITTPTLEQRLMNMGILLNETSTYAVEASASSSTTSFIRSHHHQPIDPSLLKMSCNELEFRLWWALNDFLKTTRTPVSPILLGLLPPLSIWDVYMDEYGSIDDIVIIAGMKNDDIVDATSASSSSSFVLHRIANAIQQQTQLHHKYVAVDESYPALRRQKRLSYAAAHVLENALLNAHAVTSLRQVLLQIPSTRQRLAFVYQMLQAESSWGAFQ